MLQQAPSWPNIVADTVRGAQVMQGCRMLVPAVLAAAALVAGAAPAGAQTPRSPAPAELSYTQLKPCRVFDTTKTTKIPANGSRTFRIAGISLEPQGGPAAGCGVPYAATAITLNLTAVNGASAGLATAAATGAGSSGVYLRFPAANPETEAGVVALGAQQITVKSNRAVDVSGDVTGYYAPGIFATFLSDGTMTSSSGRVLTASTVGPGKYSIRVDRDVTGCVATASSVGGRYILGASAGGSYVTVNIFMLNGQQYSTGFALAVRC